MDVLEFLRARHNVLQQPADVGAEMKRLSDRAGRNPGRASQVVRRRRGPVRSADKPHGKRIVRLLPTQLQGMRIFFLRT